MQLLEDILATLPDGDVIDVRIGLHWTAVVVDVDDERYCGLASTLAREHTLHGTPDVPQVGTLHTIPALQLARYALQTEHPTLASVGIAAMNALVPRDPDAWVDLNAEHVIAQHGAEKHVALVGRFTFVDRLRERVGALSVLEQNPQPDEYPASAAPDVLPQADVVAITGMTLQNHTLASLLALVRPGAFVIMVGPSTPLSPVLFDHGIDVLCGAVVEDIEPVLRGISQSAVFGQLHKLGVRLVNMSRAPV